MCPTSKQTFLKYDLHQSKQVNFHNMWPTSMQTSMKYDLLQCKLYKMSTTQMQTSIKCDLLQCKLYKMWTTSMRTSITSELHQCRLLKNLNYFNANFYKNVTYFNANFYKIWTTSKQASSKWELSLLNKSIASASSPIICLKSKWESIGINPIYPPIYRLMWMKG